MTQVEKKLHIVTSFRNKRYNKYFILICKKISQFGSPVGAFHPFSLKVRQKPKCIVVNLVDCDVYHLGLRFVK